MNSYIFVTRRTQSAYLYGHTPLHIKKKTTTTNCTFSREKNGARPTNPYIFRVSFIRGMSEYISLPHPFLNLKKPKMVMLPEERMEQNA